MTMQQINNNPQTPLEKLISDKRRIKRQCIIQKQKLNDDFSYIQEHAGSLLLSGVTSLLFPNSKSEKKESIPTVSTSETPLSSIGISDYLHIAQGIFHWYGMLHVLCCLLGEYERLRAGLQACCSRKRNSREQLIYVRGHIFLSIINVK